LGVSRERWSKKFSEWFDDVLWKAEIYDYGRYPVKGCGVWLPYGFKLRKNIIELIRKLLDETGHEEVLFPILIPEDLLAKEAEHIRGFSGEVYWVTHGGTDELDVKLALRPTSETIISLYESYWLKSYKQLPKKYYQIVSIFRYETKATRPMIRVREVTTFKEAHTAHHSFEDAERQIVEALKIYMRFYDELGIPYIVSKRPDWDRFAGALYTIALDTLMPDGRAMQIGTVHLLGQNFSKAFEIRVQLEDESIDYVWQTSYGISERAVASIISVHGDDHGCTLPSNIAPVQVVIIPIWIKGREADINKYSKEVYEELKKGGLRVEVDERREIGPGAKFYEWEAKGVPVRVEIGAKEVDENKVTLVRRDTLERMVVKRDNVLDEVKSLVSNIDRSIRERAKKFMFEKIIRVDNVEDAKRIIAERSGIVELPWCGRASCGHRMEEVIEARTLGSPLPIIEKVDLSDAKCAICGREAKTIMRLSKTY